jgi:hypothetical protein
MKVFDPYPCFPSGRFKNERVSQNVCKSANCASNRVETYRLLILLVNLGLTTSSLLLSGFHPAKNIHKNLPNKSNILGDQTKKLSE